MRVVVFVNPATGEGISYAMESGQMAANAIADALGNGDDPRAVAKRYERSLRWRIKPGLRGGDFFRRWAAPSPKTSRRSGPTPPPRPAIASASRPYCSKT